MKVIYKIDKDGVLIFGEEKKIGVNEELPVGYIDVPLPFDSDGQMSFYRPKWTGTEWIEDMTKEEIDKLNNQSNEPTVEEQQLEIINALGQELTMLKIQLIMGGVI